MALLRLVHSLPDDMMTELNSREHYTKQALMEHSTCWGVEFKMHQSLTASLSVSG